MWMTHLALPSGKLEHPDRVAIVTIIILPPSFSSGPRKAWRDTLKRQSNVSAAKRECLSNQHKRQRPVINTQPAPSALGFSIPMTRWRVGRRGWGTGGRALEKEPALSVGAALPGLAGST